MITEIGSQIGRAACRLATALPGVPAFRCNDQSFTTALGYGLLTFIVIGLTALALNSPRS